VERTPDGVFVRIPRNPEHLVVIRLHRRH
jgi:hypothetical protein